jgi:CheY-like chemotaxis protein
MAKTNKTALIADDSAFARRALRAVLEERGFACLEAKDGEEAIAIWREQRPNLICLDLNMPKATGYQVLETMKDDRGDSLVIVVSADVQPKARERVNALGARAMVKKPFDRAKIDAIVSLLDATPAPQEGSGSIDLAKTLEQDKLDALTEIVNIGMGQAAAALAEVLGVFLEISIPTPQLLEQFLDAERRSARVNSTLFVQQAFNGDLRGEAVAVFDEKQIGEVRSLLSSDAKESSDRELVLEMANILIGAAITSIASQLSSTVRFARPSILGRGKATLDALGHPPEAGCHLVVTIGISVEGQQFAVTLLIVLPQQERQRVVDALDRFLENAFGR